MQPCNVQAGRGGSGPVPPGGRAVSRPVPVRRPRRPLLNRGSVASVGRPTATDPGPRRLSSPGGRDSPKAGPGRLVAGRSRDADDPRPKRIGVVAPRATVTVRGTGGSSGRSSTSGRPGRHGGVPSRKAAADPERSSADSARDLDRAARRGSVGDAVARRRRNEAHVARRLDSRAGGAQRLSTNRRSRRPGWIDPRGDPDSESRRSELRSPAGSRPFVGRETMLRGSTTTGTPFEPRGVARPDGRARPTCGLREPVRHDRGSNRIGPPVPRVRTLAGNPRIGRAYVLTSVT